MRIMTFGFNCGGEVFRGSVALPDEYFDEKGRPRWNLLNSRFSSPVISWHHPIGAVPVDEQVEPKAELPPIGEELQKLRDVVASLEQKFTESR